MTSSAGSNLPYARQHVDDADVAAVAEALGSDWLTGGPACSEFERLISQYCGARFGAALSSGTAALHAACHAIGIGPGDRVWTSPISFVASANCAIYCGGAVDFVDIDPRSYNMSPASLARKLAIAAANNALPKAIVAVHFGGYPCDLAKIAPLARDYGIKIIEDATHALGASYHGSRVGCCEHSDASVFSFHAIKSITTAEGGMVVTNDERIADDVRLFRNQGLTRNVSVDQPWRYEQRELGYNYRMTEMQAALGVSQFRKLDSFVERRATLAERYDAGLADLPLQLPFRGSSATSAWHLYPVQVMTGDRVEARRRLYFELLRSGICTQVHYIPIHTQPYFRGLGFRMGEFPAAESYYDGALSLPLFVDLSERDQDRVMDVVRSAAACFQH